MLHSNKTFAPKNHTTTLIDTLQQRAGQQPAKCAYTYLVDGDFEKVRLTFGELDQRAQTIAAALQDRGATGQPVLLLHSPGLEFVAGFFGCLYAGAIAVPAQPPDPVRLNRTLPGLQAIVHDSGAKIALATSPTVMLTRPILRQALDWIATDEIDAGAAANWRKPDIGGDALALLQYTSSSMREPRGVMLTHHNLTHNLSLIHDAFELDDTDVGVSWLPLHNSMGLVGSVLQPIYTGCSYVLMSPLDFLKRPMRWLEAISRHGATVSGGPNFAYELCLRKALPEHLVMLDLGQWRMAFNGGEQVAKATIDRFSEKFAPCGFQREAFYPCYGLAEATLIVAGGGCSAAPMTLEVDKPAFEMGRVVKADTAVAPTITLVSSGPARPGQDIRIVDPESCQPALPGQVGEIWVSGPSMAAGYWNKPVETDQTFGARIDGSGAGPFLRTGDLGFLHQGELYISGRLKDLIIIDGLNHHPQDIEQTVAACHPALRVGSAVAFSVNGKGAEQLIIAAEADLHGKMRGDEVAAAVREAVASRHGLRARDVVLLGVRSLPRTSDGAIWRHACKVGYLNNALERLEC